MVQRNYWTLHSKVKGYHVWQARDGFFQITKSDTPPDTTAGYKDVNTLLKLKGLL